METTVLLLLVIGISFLYHTIEGVGKPEIVQLKVTDPPAVPFGGTLSTFTKGLTGRAAYRTFNNLNNI